MAEKQPKQPEEPQGNPPADRGHLVKHLPGGMADGLNPQQEKRA